MPVSNPIDGAVPAGGASEREEWRQNWPLVLATTVGFSFYSVAIYATGLFIKPLSDEFGWSRTEITGGLSLAALMTAPFAPLVGAMIDKWGTRTMALPGIVATALALASFGLVGDSVAIWLSLWVLYAFVSLSIKSTVWTAAVSGTFKAGRGLALAFTVTGTAIAQTVAPPLAAILIDNFGWRASFFLLAAGWGSVALLVNIFFLFDSHDTRKKEAAFPDAKSPAFLTGLAYKECFRNPALIKIAIATFLTMFFGVAILVHQVPILTDGGMSRTDAALLASLAGVAGIAGKIVTGWLMDRYDSGWIGGITISTSAIGFLLLLNAFRTPALTIAAMALIGYSTGAKFQIAAYLTSCYGGIRNFGKIFGTLSIVIAVGSGLGPVAAGAAYDMSGDYGTFLVSAIPSSLLAGFLLMRLGQAPDWDRAISDGSVRDGPANA